MSRPYVMRQMARALTTAGELVDRGYEVQSVLVRDDYRAPVVVVRPTPGCRAIYGVESSERTDGSVVRAVEGTLNGCSVQWSAE